MGWGVSPDPITAEDYFTRAAQHYAQEYKGWRKALTGFIHKMQIDDLVWFRNTKGVYYLARVLGAWRHDSTKANLAVDLRNVRNAEIYEVGISVAGKISACFRPQATLQKIGGVTALRFSQITFNSLSGTSHYVVELGRRDIFDLCSDIDIEDVVLVYLQKEHKYLLIPSSRRSDTPYYEYLLKSPDGEEAVVQVKSGAITLDPATYQAFPSRVFLFSPAGYKPNSALNVTAIPRVAIEEFIKRHRNLLPKSIQIWLEWLDKCA